MHDRLHASPVPSDRPLPFEAVSIPHGWIIHRGVFSPDLSEFYFTLSKPDFTDFTILVSEFTEGHWTEPGPAFFNSGYNDHGMSFSPDGNTLVFSSTRPVPHSAPPTWQLWRSQRIAGSWSTPEHLPIPGLQNRLISHPSLSPDGTLYFHASNTDYSEMQLYSATQSEGHYTEAQKLDFDLGAPGYCTPYISADGAYLVFASIGEHLDLYRCARQADGSWSEPEALPVPINQNGQGNPYLTPGLDYLFYASDDADGWKINWVSTQAFLER